MKKIDTDKKRISIFFFLAVLLLTAVSCSAAHYRYEEILDLPKSPLQTSMLGIPDSLSAAEEWADVTVEGVLEDGGQPFYRFPTLPEEWSSRVSWQAPMSGSTISTLRVTRVLGGTGDVKPGDRISIYEPYYVYDNADGVSTLYYYAHYLPAEPGEKYLFFLTENAYGNLAVGNEGMRFPLPDAQARSAASIDALTAEDLYLAEGVDLESYKALYREVLEAYAE